MSTRDPRLETAFKEFAIETARQAGKILLEHHGRPFAPTWKGMSDFKTAADDASDAYICREVKQAFPALRLFSEETGVRTSSAGYEVVVDPLDGTIPFSTGISDLWAVCIALCYECRPVVGITFAPLRDRGCGELFVAQDGSGAFLNGREIYVSAEAEITHVRIGLDPGKAPGRLRLNAIEAKLDADDGVNCILRHGCASVPMALVAAGRLNAYAAIGFDPFSLAVGALLIPEAGGRFSTLAGEDWKLDDQSCLGANPSLHANLLTVFGTRW